jgi:hypothetical protein
MRHRFIGPLTVLVFLFINTPAHAYFVSTTAGDFDVTRVDDTFNNFQATLQTQAWFGNRSLAIEFAGLLQDEFGLNTNATFASSGFSDFFVYELFIGGFRVVTWDADLSNVAGTGPDLAAFGDQIISYAVATEVTTGLPEPGTLGLMLAGLAGIALGRKRKQR